LEKLGAEPRSTCSPFGLVRFFLLPGIDFDLAMTQYSLDFSEDI
jgi:hypothetical protein